jgi:hypothetical protein
VAPGRAGAKGGDRATVLERNRPSVPEDICAFSAHIRRLKRSPLTVDSVLDTYVFSTLSRNGRIVRPSSAYPVTRIRPLLAVLGTVSVVAAAYVVVRHQSQEQAASSNSDTAGVLAHASLPSVVDELHKHTPPPGEAPPPTNIAGRVVPLMQEWRSAIINKNATVVESLDAVFRNNAREFVPALMVSAESDPEERVRSFSTRVLGKLRSEDSRIVVRKLLDDRSEYVRFNAAWALGELADRDSVPRLRQLEKRDPAPNVRRSATDSLRKMDGG